MLIKSPLKSGSFGAPFLLTSGSFGAGPEAKFSQHICSALFSEKNDRGIFSMWRKVKESNIILECG